MGLTSFLMKKSKNRVPDLSMSTLKNCEQFDINWMQDPQFRDLLTCVVQMAKTDLDIARINSRGYLKRLTFSKLTLKDKRVRNLFEALNVDESRFDEDGYITSVMRSIIQAAKAAKDKGKGEEAASAEHAVYVCAYVFMRHIQETHPEYTERVVAIAPAIKEAVK